jgi:very-short-patch-repair endonuclease
MNLDFSKEMIKYNPEIKSFENKIDLRKQLTLIIDRLETNGKVTRLNLIINSDMKLAINSCRVNGNPPKYINEYKALLKYYDLCAARKQLEIRWNRQMAVLGVDNTKLMGDKFELVCKKYCSLIEGNLSWYDNHWKPVTTNLRSLGVPLDLIDNHWDISNERYSRLKYIKNELGDKLIEIINSEIYRLQYKSFCEKIEGYNILLTKYSNNQNSKIINGLLQSILEENVEMYEEHYEALLHIESLSKIIERRKFLLDVLYEYAPSWAKEIENRNSLHGKGKPPTTIKEAWLYAQFTQEFIERKSQSKEDLSKDILEIEEAILRNTSELVFKKAWCYKLINFQYNRRQVQAIEGWRQLIRKIGSGKGKRAEIYKAEARKLMPSCQGAIPVWIMPLSKVVENFNPAENKFDIVIIDEASQADVMALTALYLGKKVIIVGDNEQVSPLSIGEKTEDMDKLIKEYLYDVPNDKLYSGKFSLYDLAQASGYQPIRLREHFRCVPEIIQFSNILSYNGQIKPLRDASEVKIKPATISYKVEGAVCKNKTNEKEADTIVSLILACCSNDEYSDKTFGVISLRGDKQALLIDKMLQKRMEPLEYKKREVLCGNSANFQGDERDVIFLSMVDTNEGEGPMRMNGYGNDDLYKKRYNVAVSRAKDQIWLVHSIDSDNDLKPGDIRKELLEYFKNLNSREILYNSLSKKAESEFEKDVMKSLISMGYSIVPQWQVGSYRIDMVALYNDKKVAIECDGERWHGEEKLEEDMIRQSILERLGWRFIRIKGSEFYRNKTETINKLLDKLQRMEIYPWEQQSSDFSIGYGSLIEKIKSAAERIRSQWY